MANLKIRTHQFDNLQLSKYLANFNFALSLTASKVLKFQWSAQQAGHTVYCNTCTTKKRDYGCLEIVSTSISKQSQHFPSNQCLK